MLFKGSSTPGVLQLDIGNRGFGRSPEPSVVNRRLNRSGVPNVAGNLLCGSVNFSLNGHKYL